MKLAYKIACLAAMTHVMATWGFAGTLPELVSKLSEKVGDSKIKVAVTDFQVSNKNGGQDSIVVKERITTLLAQDKNITLVERALLEKVFQEQKMQISGAISTDTIKRLGELAGADAIISGTINELLNDEIEIHARIIKVETGEILAADQAKIRKDWIYFKPLTDKVDDKKTDDAAREYFLRGTQFYKDGKFNMALEFYDKAINLKPDYFDAYRGKGMSLFLKGNYEEAMLYFGKVLDKNPEDAEARFSLAMSYKGAAQSFIKQGFDKTYSEYEESVRSNPGISFDTFLKTKLPGIYSKAIAEFDKVVELLPNHVPAYIERSDTYLMLENYAKAISDASKAIELAPKDIKGYISRAHVYYNSKNYIKAIGDYSKAIELAPKKSEPYLLRGIAAHDNKEVDKALADFGKAIELNPKDADAYMFRWMIYVEKGEGGSERAKRDYQKYKAYRQ